MSDSAYGSQPGGAMEGGTSGASGEQVSSQEGSQPERQEQQGSEQITLTRKDLEEMEQRIIEKTTRAAQSMTDKMGSRLDKEIQAALQRATQSIDLGKQAGVKYTPEQEQAIRDKAINEAYANLNTQPEASSPQASQGAEQGGQSADQQWNWVNQEVHRIMGETGVYISGDEANRLILGEDGSTRMTPFQYIQAFESLARQRQTNIHQPSGLNPAIPSYVQGGKPSETQTALRVAYDKEIRQITEGTHPKLQRGDIKGIQDMENEYRRKGLVI